MTERISRFSRSEVCPVCSGADDLPRGQGARCHGFRGTDGWVHCSREDFAGRAKFHQASQTYAHRASGACPCGVEHAPDLAPTASRREAVTTYDYCDETGELLFQVVRYRQPKSFRQRRPDGKGGWHYNLQGVRRVLYGLPELVAADPAEPVFVCEGEKDVDRLRSEQLVATCSPMGAGKWRAEFAEALKGRGVIVLRDNDEPGRTHGSQVAHSVHGTAAWVKVLDLPGLSDHGDVSDWLDSGRTIDELGRISHRAPFWEPPATLALSGSPVDRGAEASDASGLSSLTDDELGLVGAGSLEPEPVEWEWRDRIARGKINLLAGEGGDGKSQIATRVVATITTGGHYPDGTGPAVRGRCLLLGAEDGLRDTVVPRLIAAGADRSLVSLITAKVTTRDKTGKITIHPQSFQDLSYWREVFRRLPDTRLVVADPLPAFLGRGVNDNRNNEVRLVLEPFAALLDEYRVALLAITHLGKSADLKTPSHRILGSVAYSNLARTVHVTLKDPDVKGRRFLSMVKCNLVGAQPSLAYRIAEQHIPHGDDRIKTSRVEFEEGAHDIDATELMSRSRSGPKRGPEPAKTLALAEWLFDFLNAQPSPTCLGAVFDAAGAAGHIGKRREEDGKWPNVSALYRAMDMVPGLPAPRDGKRVEDSSAPVGRGGREIKFWQLVDGDAAF